MCKELAWIHLKNMDWRVWRIPPRSGRPPLISHKTLQKIEQEFKRISDGMTPKKLMQFIFDWTNITYHISHVCRLMHKWNLKPKVPQKLHVRAASKDTCRKWNKRIILRIKKERFYRIYSGRVCICR